MVMNFHLMMWGSQTENGMDCAQPLQDSAHTLWERLQRALSTECLLACVYTPMVTREQRIVDGLVCAGYSITLDISLDQKVATLGSIRALECRMEALMSVALLDLLTPVHVDFVATLHDADN